MAHFSYTAQKTDGETYQGVAEAPDRFQLYEIIRREGGKVISVDEQKHTGVWSADYWNQKMTRVKEYEKILFARNLGAMLSAGLALSRALSVMERQTKNIKLKAIIADIGSEVRRGNPLHAGLEKFPKVFPKLFVAMVRAGQEGGDLPASLTLVGDQMERMYDLKKKVKGALIYPSIIVVAIVGIGIVMMIVVVPTLAATFEQSHETLPASTQFVINVSNFLVHYTVLAIGGMIGSVVLVYLASKTKVGGRAFEFLFLHTPVVGNLMREVNAARTARTLGSLLASGVDVLTSLTIVHEVLQNSYFKQVIDEAQAAVRAGEQLSTVFEKRVDLYPPFVGEMIAVGEETGATTEMLKRIAVYYEDNVDRSTKDMSTIIEPFLMIIIGCAVGFFAVSMITPIYQLSSNIN